MDITVSKIVHFLPSLRSICLFRGVGQPGLILGVCQFVPLRDHLKHAINGIGERAEVKSGALQAERIIQIQTTVTV
jgi:hypothetical protein